MSNLTSFVAEDAFHAYHQRGQMENYIKEAKAGFYLDKITSSQFIPNYARMMLSVLAYNLVSLMRQLLPAQHQRLQVTTLRLWLFNVAGKLVTSGRQLYLKLSRHHVYQDFFSTVSSNSSATVGLAQYDKSKKAVRPRDKYAQN